MRQRIVLSALAASTATAMMLGAPRAASAAPDVCVPSRAMIVLDKSSSMQTGKIGAQTKWQIAAGALDQVAATFENKIDLGLMMFPNPDECSPGKVNVDVGPAQHGAIVSALGSPPPSAGNWTPMSQTLDAAGEVASLNDPSRSRYVILITDGWQWCDPYDAGTRFDPVDSVMALRAKGITTYVVGFGGAVDALTLNQMAVAAGTARPGCDPNGDAPGAGNACYFQADSPAELTAALEQIGVQVSTETCDGVDNDCDGLVDEDLTRACETDCGSGSESCVAGNWVGCSAPEPAVETCDGMDNDCDGATDPGCACTAGETRVCGDETGACEAGTQTCAANGTWGDCVGGRGPEPESCNGLDDDCDGVVDGESTTGAPAGGDDVIFNGLLCPPGQSCQDGECVDAGEPPIPPAGDDEGGTPASGCGCRAGGDTGGSVPAAGLWALALGALLALRRKR